MPKGRGAAIDRSEWPATGPHRDLLEVLDRLHQSSGLPSLDAIAGRMTINSRTRVNHLLRGTRGALPADSRQLDELVRALGGAEHDVARAREIFAILDERRTRRRDRTGSRAVGSTDSAELVNYVDEKLSAFGIRRTAYPIDMTLGEVVRQGLIVETAIRRNSGSASRAGRVSISSILSHTRPGLPSVVLGASGAGKTMVAYRAALRSRGQGRLAILLRAEQLEEEAPAIFRLCLPIEPESRPLIVLDGLDEALVVWRAAGGVPTVLSRLLDLAPSLATARTRAFEESSELDAAGVGFDQIYEMQEWTVESHFAAYVRKLVKRKRLRDMELLELARTSADVARLASRPLHARMLAFLHEGDDPGRSERKDPRTEVDLYSSYIDKLAQVADRGLARRGCPPSPGATTIWKDAAWRSYAHGNVRNVVSDIAPAVDTTLRCRHSAIEYIADTVRLRGQDRLDYLHYSLYEWLVAAHVADGLQADEFDHERAFRVLQHDLPREMRHFLVSIVKPIDHARSRMLTDAYWHIRQNPTLDERSRRLASNLIIYLIGRASVLARAELEGIVRRETDPFLLNSALWALGHLSSADALEVFAEHYATDEEWRAISRGYTLYYYGDLGVDSGPPYRDVEPYAPCERAVAKVLDMLLDDEYILSVPIERQVIDALIVFDIIRIRSNALTNREFAAATEVIRRMDERNVTPVAINLLRECVQDLFMQGGYIGE